MFKLEEINQGKAHGRVACILLKNQATPCKPSLSS